MRTDSWLFPLILIVLFAGFLGLFVWWVYLAPQRDFPFPFTGGHGQAAVFTVLGNGEIATHEACVIGAWGDGLESLGVDYWVRPLDDATLFFEQARAEPFVFYELDRGSGVASFCADSLNDPALAGRVTATMAERCPELGQLPPRLTGDPSRIVPLSAFGGDDSPCRMPDRLLSHLR